MHQSLHKENFWKTNDFSVCGSDSDGLLALLAAQKPAAESLDLNSSTVLRNLEVHVKPPKKDLFPAWWSTNTKQFDYELLSSIASDAFDMTTIPLENPVFKAACSKSGIAD